MSRPRIEIDLKRVEALASRGLTNDQIARSLGIHPATLYERKAQFSEFAEAIKNGQSKGITEITNSLYENAKNGNLGAQIFFLTNRDPENWKNTAYNKNEHTGKDGAALPVLNVVFQESG